MLRVETICFDDAIAKRLLEASKRYRIYSKRRDASRRNERFCRRDARLSLRVETILCLCELRVKNYFINQIVKIGDFRYFTLSRKSFARKTFA